MNNGLYWARQHGEMNNY